jgi:hypothetical protein
MQNGLRIPSPPRLPTANEVYTRQDQELVNNALRLYFNQMSNGVQSIAGVNGGRYVDCPNGLFFNTADQIFPVANTAYPVVYNQTYLDNAVALQSGSTSRIQVDIGGIYNFQYSGQLESTNSSSKDFFLWIRRDGVDIGYSTRAYSISGSGTYRTISYSFNIDMQAGQYLELVASASDTSLDIGAETATAPHPGIPSSVMTVNYISPLPDTLPTPP